MVEKAREAVFVIQDGVFVYVNPKVSELSGYSEDQLISKPFVEFIHPEDRNAVLQRHLQRLSGQELPGHSSFRILDASGNVQWAETHATFIEWDGRPAVLAFAKDITERKLAEEALRVQKERFQILSENAPFGMVMIGHDGTFKYVNPKFTEIFGYDLGDVPNGAEWCRRAYPDQAYRHQVIAAWAEDMGALGLKVTKSRVFAVICKDGSEKIIHFTSVKLGSGEDLMTCEDITERKRAETELLKSEEKYRTLFEESRDAVIMTTRDGKVEAANQAFLDLFGFTREEAENMDILDIYVDPADRIKFQADIERHGSLKDYEVRRRKKDGTEIECLLTSTVRMDEEGTIIGYQGIIRDLSLRRRLQRQLLQAQKMEAVGTLAGGVAHDFNNLLTVIQGYSELLLLDANGGSPEQADLQKISDAARRGSELVRNLLAISRKADIQPRLMNLNHEVERVRQLLGRTIPKMIEIELHLSTDLATINADTGQMMQVLMNLAVNARDAMPEGGKLTFATSNVYLDADNCEMLSGAKPGKYVLLVISDTGEGMDEETLGHLFEPFYTTKEVGKGTGLGLATVYGIVQQHGGHITCRSEPDQGTTFNIYLPAMEEVSEKSEDVAEPTRIAGGTETILLIDDEKFIRDFGEKVLTRAGYTVLTAAGGPEALELYLRSGDTISLVILDLIMPEMGGEKCLEEILEINPEAKVLISSGAALEARKKEIIESACVGCITKPFRLGEMLQAVREALDSM